MVTYPGLPVPEIHAVLDRATSAGRYAPGVTFQIDLITLCGNTGTYMDSPFHRPSQLKHSFLQLQANRSQRLPPPL